MGEGKSLGQLGTTKVRAVEVFDWFDEADIGIGNVSSLVLIDFMRQAREINEKDLEKGLNLLHEAFTQIVVPQDFGRFWAACLRERQEADDLMALMVTLVENLSERPTSRRSGSSPGRRSTGPKSKGDSSSRKVQDRFERGGRADLAIAVRDVRRAGSGR